MENNIEIDNLLDNLIKNIEKCKITEKKEKRKPKLVIVEDFEKPKPKLVIEEEQTNKKLLTEDLGKIFEMAICLLYETEFDGKYKYSLDEAEKLKERIKDFKKIFPNNLKHTAKGGNQYDFMDIENNIKLSAKTTKKDGKVCPQVIGQPSKKKFCQFFHLDLSLTLDQIKNYIYNNIHSLLHIYVSNTFDCPILYYNRDKDKVLFIKQINKTDWESNNIEFSHIKKNKIWNESTCISINNITIGEFQVHNHRDNIKFRWCFENLLLLCKDDYEIIEL